MSERNRTAKERVALGAAWLDEVLPDWWNGADEPKVDLGVLDIASCTYCMLGQLEVPLRAALNYQPPKFQTTPFHQAMDGICDYFHIYERQPWFGDHGFTLSWQQAKALTKEWRAEIERRRAA